MLKKIILLLRPALSESMKVILLHKCAYYKCGGTKRKKNLRMEKSLSDVMLPVYYSEIIMQVFISTAFLLLMSSNFTVIKKVIKSKDSDKDGLPCLFCTFCIWTLWITAANEFLSRFLIWLINSAVIIVSPSPWTCSLPSYIAQVSIRAFHFNWWVWGTLDNSVHNCLSNCIWSGW